MFKNTYDLFRATHRLIYNDKIIGYRIVRRGTEINYDISVDDFFLAMDDFPNFRPLGQQPLQDVPLVSRGKMLYPADNTIPDAQNITYGGLANALSYYHMADTSVDLKILYNKYNVEYFDNLLPRLVQVMWSKRMKKSAAVCRTTRKRGPNGTWDYLFKIVVSEHYHRRFPDELRDTLVHEMIHVLLPEDGHGYRFKEVMYRLNELHGLNISINATGVAYVAYTYECVNCHKVIELHRRLKDLDRYRCSTCHGALMEEEVDYDEPDYVYGG